MKIKHILTLFCVTLTLAFFLVSCAASSEGSNETADNQSNLDYQSNSNFQSNLAWIEQSNLSNTDWINSITVADVSKENCEHADLSLNCFISVWNTENSGNGASATNEVKLPLVEGGTYDFYVDWGDESDVQKITSSDDATHAYASNGEKTIHIAGTFKGWRFFVSEALSFGDAVKLLNVTQWGSLSLGNTDGRQFQGAKNFNPTATDAPDVSETTSLAAAFLNASNFNADISDWDVSQVTDMAYMFNFATSFNNNGKPLDWGPKTSKVTSMYSMFSGASVFNQDISAWDVSNVEDMSFMFNGATDFNQNISGWKVEKVAQYDGFATGSALITAHIPPKFRGANAVSKEVCEAKPKLNCFISVWNTDYVPISDAIKGYSGTKMVKLPLVSEGTYDFYVNWGDGEDVEKIEAYNADKITHTYATPGEYTVHITGTIKGWRFFASEALNFGDATKLTDVTQWGSLSLGNTAGRQFYGAENFNPTASDAPNLSETTSLDAAFTGAISFNADISDWDVSQVTNMRYMFFNAEAFNNNGMVLDWGIKTSNVTDMEGMFNGATDFNQDISKWDVAKVTASAGFATGSGIANKPEYQPAFKSQ